MRDPSSRRSSRAPFEALSAASAYSRMGDTAARSPDAGRRISSTGSGGAWGLRTGGLLRAAAGGAAAGATPGGAGCGFADGGWGFSWGGAENNAPGAGGKGGGGAG